MFNKNILYFISSHYPQKQRLEIDTQLLAKGYYSQDIEAAWEEFLNKRKEPILNAYLVSFISKHYPEKPRMEIDKELLERGYDANAIDAVWQTVISRKVKSLSFWNRHRDLKIVVVIANLGITCLILNLLLSFFDGPFFDYVPDYPGSTQVTLDATTDYTIFRSGTHKMLATKDSKDQILAYYNNYAKSEGYNYIASEDDPVTSAMSEEIRREPYGDPDAHNVATYLTILDITNADSRIGKQLSNILGSERVIVLRRYYSVPHPMG